MTEMKIETLENIKLLHMYLLVNDMYFSIDLHLGDAILLTSLYDDLLTRVDNTRLHVRAGRL